MGYNARNDEIRDKVVGVIFALLAGVAVASAEDIKVRCPSEGSFDAPLEIAGIPNPAAGWQTFLEGKPRKIDLSAPPGKDGFWLITCHIDVGGALVPINAHVGGTKTCRFAEKGVSTLPNGGQICVVGAGQDSCLITCR
jgi:hypothetical protein